MNNQKKQFIIQIKEDKENNLYSGFVRNPPRNIYSESEDLATLFENMSNEIRITNDEIAPLPKIVGIIID